MTSFSSINAKIGKTIDTIADLASLRAYRPARIVDGDTVLVTSGATLGDQEGGAFVWVEDSTAPDDGQQTIRPGHAIGQGRWVKMFGTKQGVAVADPSAEVVSKADYIALLKSLRDAQIIAR